MSFYGFFILVFFFIGNTICLLFPRRFLLFSAKIIAAILQYIPLFPLDRNIRVLNYYLQTTNRPPCHFYTTKRRNIYYSLKSLIDFFKYMVQTPHKINEILQPSIGEAEFLEIYKKKQGVIGICLHYGNWELGGNYLSGIGVTFYSLFFQQIDVAFDYILNRIRKKCQIGLLHQKGGLRAAVGHLREGKMITLLGDQDGTRNGYFQSFMGLYCSFPRAVELFVRKTEAAIVPVIFIHDDKTEGYLARYYPSFGHAADFRGDLTKLHEKIRDFYEEVILADPAQWLLFYNRFCFRHDSLLQELGIWEKVHQEFERAWQG